MITFSRILILFGVAAPWALLAIDSVCAEKPNIFFALLAFPVALLLVASTIKKYKRDIEFYRRGPQYYSVDSGVTLYTASLGELDGYTRLLGFYPLIALISSFFTFAFFLNVYC